MKQGGIRKKTHGSEKCRFTNFERWKGRRVHRHAPGTNRRSLSNFSFLSGVVLSVLRNLPFKGKTQTTDFLKGYVRLQLRIEVRRTIPSSKLFTSINIYRKKKILFFIYWSPNDWKRKWSVKYVTRDTCKFRQGGRSRDCFTGTKATPPTPPLLLLPCRGVITVPERERSLKTSSVNLWQLLPNRDGPRDTINTLGSPRVEIRSELWLSNIVWFSWEIFYFLLLLVR